MSRSETKIKKYEALVETCDEAIRSGRMNEVIAIVTGLNFADVPRSFRQALAKIARRCGLVEEGLTLLHPVMTNEKLLETVPTAGEICEYSVLLSRNGSIAEALDLLRDVDPGLAPEALLYTGFCHVSSWDYGRALVSFERYLESEADAYSKLIARVNLAACYVVVSERPGVEAFITETLELALQANATRLAGNCHELRAQYHLNRGDLGRASVDLDLAHSIFGASTSYDQLLIEKWRAVIETARTGSTDALQRFRALAVERRFWEFVRDADLLALRVEFDQRRFDHLIYGTPTEAYRSRILDVLDAEPSSSYVWGEESGAILDLRPALESASGLKPGKKVHQMIVALSRDFYAPRRSGPLFAELYPTERFDVHSSNTKVRQIMKRTRRWFEDNRIPLAIEYRNGGYRLASRGGIGLRLELSREPFATDDLRWLRLKARFGDAFFRSSEACEVLGTSRTSFHVWVETKIAEGRLLRVGTGKGTRYQLAQFSDFSRAA